MKIKISQVQSLMTKAHKVGYEPILTVNGEYVDIDYMDKKKTERAKVIENGQF